MAAIYLAAAFARNPEMRGVRDQLRADGHRVVSTWHDIQDGDAKEALFDEQLATNPGHCAKYAIDDLDDLLRADMVVSFTGGGGRGGRHVEFGFALATGRRMIMVGPREHVFHCLAAVQWYPTWPACLAALTEAGAP